MSGMACLKILATCMLDTWTGHCLPPVTDVKLEMQYTVDQPKEYMTPTRIKCMVPELAGVKTPDDVEYVNELVGDEWAGADYDARDPRFCLVKMHSELARRIYVVWCDNNKE